MTAILIILLVVTAFCLIWPVFTEPKITNPEDQIHIDQQAALKRHNEYRKKERKRAEAYWKERGRSMKIHRSEWDGEISYESTPAQGSNPSTQRQR